MPFFDNKQLIHMAAESVLLVIILFYCSYQNKKLRVGLNTCTKRLKEQELILIRKLNPGPFSNSFRIPFRFTILERSIKVIIRLVMINSRAFFNARNFSCSCCN